MKSDIQITHKREEHKKQEWKLQGNTVVKGMDSTEMLFRIATMGMDDFESLANNLSKKELHDIVMQIRAHRKEGQSVGLIPKTEWPSVTKYVINKHLTTAGLI